MKAVLKIQVGGTHYKDFKIQPVEFIQANRLSFLEGCIVKRLCRYRAKGGIEDLLKAQHEIEILIALEYPEYKYTLKSLVKRLDGGSAYTESDPCGDGGLYHPLNPADPCEQNDIKNSGRAGGRWKEKPDV